MGENQHPSFKDLNAAFVQDVFVNRHGMPDYTTGLFSSLMTGFADKQNIKSLHTQQKAVFAHVDRALAEAI